MSLRSQFILKYAGSLQIAGGEPYAGSSFSLGNILQMKSSGVKVILNSNGLGFAIDLGETLYVDNGVTYTFSEDCIIAFATAVEVV